MAFEIPDNFHPRAHGALLAIQTAWATFREAAAKLDCLRITYKVGGYGLSAYALALAKEPREQAEAAFAFFKNKEGYTLALFEHRPEAEAGGREQLVMRAKLGEGATLEEAVQAFEKGLAALLKETKGGENG